MIKINSDAIPSRGRRRDRGTGRHRNFYGHAHHHHRLSRRQFVKVGAALIGATAVYSMLGDGMRDATALAAPPGSGLPTQIPGFSPLLAADTGLEIPFFLPIEIDPFDPTFDEQDPSTITDFNGFIGVVEADGVSNNNSEGVDRRWACDVRFMHGVFRDREGRSQPGTFGFF